MWFAYHECGLLSTHSWISMHLRAQFTLARVAGSWLAWFTFGLLKLCVLLDHLHVVCSISIWLMQVGLSSLNSSHSAGTICINHAHCPLAGSVGIGLAWIAFGLLVPSSVCVRPHQSGTACPVDTFLQIVPFSLRLACSSSCLACAVHIVVGV